MTLGKRSYVDSPGLLPDQNSTSEQPLDNLLTLLSDGQPGLVTEFLMLLSGWQANRACE